MLVDDPYEDALFVFGFSDDDGRAGIPEYGLGGGGIPAPAPPETERWKPGAMKGDGVVDDDGGGGSGVEEKLDPPIAGVFGKLDGACSEAIH